MKLHNALPATSILLGSLTAFSSYAQNSQTLELANNNTNNASIETITIAGTRAPIAQPHIAGSISVIDKAKIEASGAISIIDLLRTVPSVNISQTGPLGTLSELRFRGSESNHVMVLLDGIAINDLGQGSLADLSHLLLSNIERIEILRGPQSAIWGSNAIAGIISISTKQASSEQPEGNVNIAIGDRKTYQLSANAAKQTEKYGLSVNAATFSTQGENISRQGNEDDGYQNTSVSTRANYLFSPHHRINFNARLLNYTSESDNYDSSTGLVADGDSEAQGEQISLGINWHFAPSTKGVKNGIYSQLLSLQYSEQTSDNYANNSFERAAVGQTLRLLWSNRFEFSANKWLNIGLENTQEDFSQRGNAAQSGVNQERSNDAYSFVSDGLYALSDKLSLSASYRYDKNDIFDNASSYRVGASYALNNNWRVFVSRGKAVKNPSFIERFGYFPAYFQGNANLIPEQQTSTEAGIEVNSKHISAQVNWFKSALSDEILGFVYDANSGQFTAQNSAVDSERQGLEISLQSQLAGLDWQAQYSYLDATENNQIELRRAQHTGSISATYKLNVNHLVYVQADYAGTKFDTFFPPDFSPSQVVPMGAYWLLSTNYQYTHNKHLQFSLRLSNALNEDYEDVLGYSGDGSRALANLRYTW